MKGMNIRSYSGTDGKIVVPGLGAVVGTFSRWTIRREDSGRAGPRWSLHAVLSYHNDVLLKNDAVKKKMICVLSKDQKIEIRQYESFRLEGATLIVEGVSQ